MAGIYFNFTPFSVNKMSTKSNNSCDETVIDCVFINKSVANSKEKINEDITHEDIVSRADPLMNPTIAQLKREHFSQTNSVNMSEDTDMRSSMFESCDSIQYRVNLKNSIKEDKEIRNIILKHDFDASKFIKMIQLIQTVDILLYVLGVRLDPIKKYLVHTPKASWYNIMRVAHNVNLFLVTTSLLLYFLLYFVKNLNAKQIAFDVNFVEFIFMMCFIFTTIYVTNCVKYNINLGANYAFDVHLLIETLIYKDDIQAEIIDILTNRIVLVTSMILAAYYSVYGYFLYYGFTSFIFIILIISAVIIVLSVVKYILMCKIIKFRVHNINKYLFDINFYFNDQDTTYDLRVITNWYPKLYTSVKEFDKFNKIFIKMLFILNCYAIANSIYLIIVIKQHLTIHIFIYVLSILLTPISLSVLIFGNNLDAKTVGYIEEYMTQSDSIDFMMRSHRIYSYITSRKVYLSLMRLKTIVYIIFLFILFHVCVVIAGNFHKFVYLLNRLENNIAMNQNNNQTAI